MQFVPNHVSIAQIAAFSGISLALFLAGGAIYRLYFSPLAKFPGPKIAALTLWYEWYYEVIHHGRYYKKIDEMHDKYGPIVRINPFEVHIKDSHYYDYLYNLKLEKYPWSVRVFGNPEAVFGSPSVEAHRRRRAALSPFFSKKSVLKLEDVIKVVIENFSKRIVQFQKAHEPVPLTYGYVAVTTDIITEYCFARSYNFVDKPDFEPEWLNTMVGISELGHVIKQSYWIYTFMNSLPDNVVAKMNPAMTMLISLRRDIIDQIKRVMSGHDDLSYKKHPTVFQEVLDSNLPAYDKTLDRLGQEGQLVIGAGTTTTAHSLTVSTYHLANNPAMFAKLRAELEEAIPNPSVVPNLSDIERLPYLTAVVQEGLRLSYGLAGRMSRVSPKEPIVYKDWVIPAGVPVSQSIPDIHHDPEIFPDPLAFKPERWLEPTLKSGERLDKYLCSFSKGPRACLGINLAYAELYMVTATIFRRFEFELYETSIENVSLVHDFMIPAPIQGTKGVRVLVKDSIL